MTSNYYALLGITPAASRDDILAAYERRRAEPDAAAPPVAAELEAAIAVLADPEQRRAYDVDQLVASPSERAGISGREILFGVIGVVVGLLVLSGVWLMSDRGTSTPPTLSEVAPYAAPDFTLENLKGESVRLSDFKGKVVVVNFWGTFCEPCKQETPALQTAYARLQDEGLVILGVDLLNSERTYNRGAAEVQRFAENYGVSYPIVLDDSGAAAQAYSIAPIPTSYFIDPQGKVRYIRVGELSTLDVERTFRKLQSSTD